MNYKDMDRIGIELGIMAKTEHARWMSRPSQERRLNVLALKRVSNFLIGTSQAIREEVDAKKGR